MTVVDTDPKSNPTDQRRREPTRTSHPPNLETAIIRLVEQDPFASISEIKAEINFGPGNLSTTWWQVFSVLRQRKLLTKRSRFKYILGRR